MDFMIVAVCNPYSCLLFIDSYFYIIVTINCKEERCIHELKN